MKLFIPFLAVWLPSIALAAPDQAKLKLVLEIQDSTVFTTRFSQLLLEVAPADMPAFREALANGFEKKTLPRRHNWIALGLADTHWAEIDVKAYAAACDKGLGKTPPDGPLRAAILLLESDEEAAIRLATSVDLEKDYGMDAFLAELIVRKPQRALTLAAKMREIKGNRVTMEPMLTRWAEADPAAAWAALPAIDTAPEKLTTFRSIVAAATARRDPAAAAQLINSIAEVEVKKAAAVNLIFKLTTDDERDTVLGLCRALQMPEAWQSFAANLRISQSENPIRILGESLPEAELTAGITAFFTREGYPTEPGFPNGCFLPLVADDDQKTAIIIGIVRAHLKKNHIPLPDELVAATLAKPDAVLAESTALPVREVIVKRILSQQPMALLPWMLSIRDADWGNFSGFVSWTWDRKSRPQDVQSLLENPHPRAKSIGLILADRWLDDAPAAAFPVIVRLAPQLIDRHTDFPLIAGGDRDAIAAMLKGIADPSARRSAEFSFARWQAETLPPAETIALVTALLPEIPKEERDILLETVAARQDAEFDGFITAIPGASGQDELRAERASPLMATGLEERALALWKGMQSDAGFFQALEAHGRRHQWKPARWEPVLKMIAARPGAEAQEELIAQISAALVATQGKIAIRIAGEIPEGAFRTEFLEATRRIALVKSGDPTWADALALGLKTSEGNRIGILALTRMAEDDPKAALAALIKAGPEAMDRAFLGPVLRGLAPQDPAAAFAFVRNLDGAEAVPLMEKVLLEWLPLDPRAATEACMALPPEQNHLSLLTMTVGRWIRMDETAVSEWLPSQAQGQQRTAVVRALISHQAEDFPDTAAQAFLKEFPKDVPPDLAVQIARQLSTLSYERACRFLLDLDGRIAPSDIASVWAEIIGKWLSSEPEKVVALLKALPATAHAATLASALTALAAAPETAAHLAGWTPPAADAKVDEPAPKVLAKLVQGGYEREPLSMADLAAITIEMKQAIVAGEDRGALNTLCLVMLRQRMENQIPLLLRDLDTGEDVKLATLSNCTEQLLGSRPGDIDIFLDAIAADFPEGLEIAAATIWTRFLSAHEREIITPLQASALLRLPAEKRNAIMLRPVRHPQPFAAAFTAHLLDPAAATRRSDTQEKILLALAAADLPAALEAAISLPAGESDPLVRGILASFATRETALTAILGIKDAAGSQRARAWLDALRPEPGK